MRAPGSRRLFYLSLERLRPASAADTHVRGLLGGLERLGWSSTLFAEVGAERKRPGMLRQLLRYVRLQAALAARIWSCDVLYVRQHLATAPVVWLARLFGRPAVLELNGLPADVMLTYPRLAHIKWFVDWCYRTQFRSASQVLVVTEGLADFVRGEAPRASITVVANGADANRFKSAGQPRPVDAPEGRYVITYGDFAHWHNLKLVFDAVRSSEWPRDVKCLLIGRGTATQETLVDADLSEHVTWLDWRPQPDLVAYIVHAMAGIVPIEGLAGRADFGAMPLKLMEMLACGRPAIVTELPTQADLVRTHGCGIVVSRDDPHDLSRAVARLAAEPATVQEMGARGRAIVEVSYSWDAIAKQVDGILRRLS